MQIDASIAKAAETCLFEIFTYVLLIVNYGSCSVRRGRLLDQTSIVSLVSLPPLDIFESLSSDPGALSYIMSSESIAVVVSMLVGELPLVETMERAMLLAALEIYDMVLEFLHMSCLVIGYSGCANLS